MNTRTKPVERLEERLRSFHLHRSAERLADVAQEAVVKNWPPLEFLEALLSEEAAARHERIVAQRLREAKIPVLKTMENFDWTHPASIPRQLIMNTFTFDFLEKKENFVLVGPAGVGKSHIAQALAFAACQREIKTRWIAAAELINILRATRADHSTEKVLKHFTGYRLLVIDELGFLPLDKEGSDLFFQLISRRYEQGSVVLTTNRPFKQWGQIFNDNTVASAILDRLVHHCQLARIGGTSYRLRNQQENLDKPD
jgi:DNA replication protein DnaC